MKKEKNYTSVFATLTVVIPLIIFLIVCDSEYFPFGSSCYEKGIIMIGWNIWCWIGVPFYIIISSVLSLLIYVAFVESSNGEGSIFVNTVSLFGGATLGYGISTLVYFVAMYIIIIFPVFAIPVIICNGFAACEASSIVLAYVINN